MRVGQETKPVQGPSGGNVMRIAFLACKANCCDWLITHAGMVVATQTWDRGVMLQCNIVQVKTSWNDTPLDTLFYLVTVPFPAA